MGLSSSKQTKNAEISVLRPDVSSDPGRAANPGPGGDSENTNPTHRRLLCVDGNPAVAEAFVHALKRRSNHWEVASVKSSAEAISKLAQTPMDGIVTSARLSDGTGVDLLNEVSRRFPKVVRLIRFTPEDKPLLRGFVGWPPMHLSRDLEPAEVEAGLESAFEIAGCMSNPAIKALLPQMLQLPTVEPVYDKVMALLGSPNAAIEEVGQLIAQDPALTIKMLQSVNSAAFALAHPVTSALEAVSILGAERTKSLILVANKSLHWDSSACQGFSLDHFWRHSLATATLARAIVGSEVKDARLADQAFTNGLLHDIGKLFFAANCTAKYSKMLAIARQQRISDADAEKLAFGTNHAELGACLLGTWGLPLEMLRPICWHHAPSDSGDGAFSVLTAVHAANAIDHSRTDGPESLSISKLDHRYLSRLGLNGRFMRWRELNTDQALAA